MVEFYNAYAMFAFFASLCALWAMQRVTTDANLNTRLGKVKWCHRAAIALTSVIFAASAANALYYQDAPHPVDFLLIFVLLTVLVLSVMRHMQVPQLRELERFKKFYYGDHSQQ